MQRKSFELKEAQIEANTIAGRAAVMGNLDRGGDVIYPGAFRKALAAFLKSGFVADNHDWAKMIAMPRVAREEGRCLYTEAVFHSTPDAQMVRQKCRERMENGLSVGLSIGFALETGSCTYFEDGPALLAHAEEAGQDIALFDSGRIRAYKRPVRAILNVPALYEYSIVSVPMNEDAQATDAKNLVRARRRLSADLLLAELDVGRGESG